MRGPIETLKTLNLQTLELDEVQAYINYARNAAPRNQVLQLELDRQQTQLDESRERIETLKTFIAMSN